MSEIEAIPVRSEVNPLLTRITTNKKYGLL
jgi:hypothetical protein